MLCYCLHCRKKTQSKNPVGHITKNNKPIIKSRCAECNHKKCRILKKADMLGSGVSFPGEKHLPGKQFCGPGTNVKERIELMKQGESLPVDEIDSGCLTHDVNYGILRRIKSLKHLSDEDLRKLTQMVDRKLMEDIRNAKDAGTIERLAMISAFKAKKLFENTTGKTLFVGRNKGKDVTEQQYPGTKVLL